MTLPLVVDRWPSGVDRVCRTVYNEGMTQTSSLNQTFPYASGPGTVNGQPVPDDYMDEAGMAEEAAALSGSLDKKQWRTILAAVRTGLPVVITHNDGGTGRKRTITALIQYANIHTPNSSRIRVSYWGFGHDVWASEIVSVETPDVTFA